MERRAIERNMAMSTRFSLACGLVGVDAGAFHAYEAALVAELTDYAELAVSAQFDQIGLTTVGQGQDFVDRVAALMGGLALPQPEIDRFLRTCRYLDPFNVFTQLERSVDGTQSFRWYLRRRPQVDRLLAIALAEGDSAAALEQVRDIAAVLHKDTVHFYSRKVGPQGPTTRFYLSQYADNPVVVRDRLREACRRGLGDLGALDPAIRVLRLPKGATAFLGVGLQGDQVHRLKLTTPGFPAPGLFDVLDLVGRDRRRVERLAQVERALDVDGPGYMSIDATRSGIDRVKLYYKIPTSTIGRA